MYDLADARMAAVIEQVLSAEKADDEWDWDELEDALQEQFNTAVRHHAGHARRGRDAGLAASRSACVEREKELARTWLMYFQRHFSLEEIDQQWIEHLKTMDALREGIGLHGYGQKDPKKEYKKAGFDMFAEMMGRIQANTVSKLFRVQVEQEEAAVPARAGEGSATSPSTAPTNKTEEETAEPTRRAQRRSRRGGAAAASPASPADGGEASRPSRFVASSPKVGRNDPCPCGSGKKYKKCHGKDEEAAASE